MQQNIAFVIVLFAAASLVWSAIGWVRRGGKPANCPGCGSCGKPQKRPSALLTIMRLRKK